MAPPTNETTIGLLDEDEFSGKRYPLPQKRRSRLSYAALWAIVLVQAVVILLQHEGAQTACKDPLYLYCMYTNLCVVNSTVTIDISKPPLRTLSNMS